MVSHNEKTILKIIKYAPICLIIILSLLLSISLYVNNQAIFNEEKNLLKEEFIKTNKEMVKAQVERVHNFIIRRQSQAEENLKKSLKERVNEAHAIAMNIYKENSHLKKDVVTKMIKDALRNIRFNNGRGYFFIYSFDYECILLPIAKRLEGSSFYNFKDGKGKYLTRDIVSQVKNDKEGFMTWWFHKPSDMKKQFKKIGFNKHFEPYDWFIGTGEYIEDFENDMKKDILSHIHKLTYENDGYIFVLDFKGNYLNHIRKDIIGLNALEVKDTRSHQTVLDSIKMARNNGSGYITYIQNKKPGTDKSTKKISYIKGFEKWNWFIGKGFYEDDLNKLIENKRVFLEEKFSKSLENVILATIVLTIILLLISIKISSFLQKRFESYHDEIEENIIEITKQQNILAQQSKMAAIGTMIGNIAHQWRQPLSMISTAATGTKLKKEIGDLKDNELFENLDYINDSTQYLSKTIDDFRNFFNTNKVKKEFTVLEAIENTFNLISAQFKNHDIEIIKDINDFKIYGIQTELVQVLINILNNSRDELLKLKEQRKLIFISAYTSNDKLIIKIKDNAGGVPEDVLEHVFEPYYTTKHEGQGTGIGLYMSNEIIEKHMEGSISMDNINYDYENKNYKGAITTIVLKQS